MRATLIVTALISAAPLVYASPIKARSPYAVKDSHHVPSKWERVGPAPGDHMINLQIGLEQNRFDELERHLYEVSDPNHQRYGQHLSKEEVEELVRPSDESHNLLHEWLHDNGIDVAQLSYSPAKDWVHVTLPISMIERLLDTEYSVYEHEEGDSIVRAPVWSLPLHLHEHVTTIQPTNSFFRASPRKRMVTPVSKVDIETLSAATPDVEGDSVAKVCNTNAVTPLCLRTFYHTLHYTPQAAGKNVVGLTDYLGESNNRSDVEIFLNHFRPEAAKAAKSFQVVIIANGNNQQTPDTPKQLKHQKDIEGNLDAETLLGIDYPTPLIAYTTGGSPPFKADKGSPHDTNEPYMTWLNYVLKAKNVPQTISTSYGDDEQTVPLSYATAVCKGFAQLGARGHSILFASGDNGVGPNGDCITNDGKKTPTFLPSFPPTCPYVTAVGATKNFSPEVAAHDPRNGFSSGGGYSNYFSRPSYQDSVVPAYTKSLKGEFDGLYNKSGRAYPDISAQGQHFITVWDGKGVIVDGTSASTPTASAIIALVNDALIAKGKSPLGFLNPLIYSIGNEAFNDIISGSAIGCGGKGFPTAKGWDPVTGFGTPKFHKLVTAALAGKRSL